MLAAPVTLATALVTLLACAFYFFTSVKVGQMRVKHGIKAPATSGHEAFDRAFRVQMNTLEHLPVFIAVLWLTAIYFQLFAWVAPILGVAWIIGRAMYMDAYLHDAAKRGPGFGVTAIAEILLLLTALAGVLMTWAGM